jgi:hypothetical protein
MAKVIRKSAAESKRKEMKKVHRYTEDEGNRSPKKQFGSKKQARKS